jgi:hypothetical protein
MVRNMKAVVDRIEDGVAVLILWENNGALIRLPIFLLPDAREGDLLNILITRDEVGTEAAREKSRNLIDKLDKKFTQSPYLF